MAKKAIVMGATSGIGMEVALCLASRGWTVGIAGRRTDRLEALRQRMPHAIICRQRIDVTQSEAPAQLEQLIAELGGMDLYFHSSGIGWQNEMLRADKELSTVETNVVGFTRMVDAAFAWFASHSQRGHIACITSIAGTKGLGAAPAYSASKRFQSHYLESLSQLARMRHLPIRVSDIRPGFVKTDLIAGGHYPMQLDAGKVADEIVRSIENGREVTIVDFRYRLFVALWRLIPRWLWVRLKITTSDEKGKE